MFVFLLAQSLSIWPMYGFALALVVQFVGVIIVLVRMHQNISELKAGKLDERVHKLEWQMINALDLQKEFKENMHKVRDTLQQIVVKLEVLSDLVERTEKGRSNDGNRK